MLAAPAHRRGQRRDAVEQPAQGRGTFPEVVVGVFGARMDAVFAIRPRFLHLGELLHRLAERRQSAETPPRLRVEHQHAQILGLGTERKARSEISS